MRRKKDTKNRKEALKDHLPNMSRQPDANAAKAKGKGTGKDKDGNPQICFNWRNNGSCAKKDAGTCVYTHPNNAKGIGAPKGGKGGKDGNTNAQPRIHHEAAKAQLAAASQARHARKRSQTCRFSAKTS